jgi:hypothetical protein
LPHNPIENITIIERDAATCEGYSLRGRGLDWL